jgi:Zn-dependent protease
MLILRLLDSGPLVALAFVLAIVIGITIHEFAHALAGYLQGDMTAKDAGRLTLNPIAHLDPVGSIMLLMEGFGWGRPTPYNPYNLKDPKYGPLMVALFGPLSNLIVVIIALILFVVFAPQFGVSSPFDVFSLFAGQGNLLMVFLVYLYSINIMLMIFNLLPIPPLDGSQIVFTLLPEKYNHIKVFLAKNGTTLLFGLVLLSILGILPIFSGIFSFFIGLLAGLV